MTLFYPQVVSQKPHAVPPVSFSRLTVQNQEVDYDASREVNILDKHITEATRIDLPYKQGLGLKLTKDFDSWGDLFKRKKKKKK